MDMLLAFFIVLAVVCLGYSLLIYGRKIKVSTAMDGWSLKREEDHLNIHFRNVNFLCDCEYGGEGDGLERRFIIKTIHIHLKGHPSQLTGWTKNDLYTIEQKLLVEFPESNMIWDEPMKTLIDGAE